MTRLRSAWQSYRDQFAKQNLLGKGLLGCLPILLVCGICFVCTAVYGSTLPARTPTPAAIAIATVAPVTATLHVTAIAPTTPSPLPTQAPTATVAPTNVPVPTNPPAPTHAPKPTDAPTPTTVPKPTSTPAPTATVSPADALTALARQTFGDRLISATLGGNSSDRYATVEYDMGTQWDEGTAVFSAQTDFLKFAPQVFALPGIDSLQIVMDGDFKDALGNTKKEAALKFTISGALAKKINWQGISIHTLEAALATDPDSGVFVHPALRDAWNASQH